MAASRPERNTRLAPESLRQGKRVPLQQRINALVDAMHRCLSSAKPLNFSDAAHREITEALRTVAYETGSSPTGALLKVQYGDGSLGAKLNLQCLTEAQARFTGARPTLHVGTLSFRHLDYDDRIDLYLIRDRETRTLSNAEVEELAYVRMKELIEDPVLRRVDSHVMLYQTGLEPLIVGAYRAVIGELLVRRAKQLPSLTLQPVFFADEEGSGKGRLWE
jgi:hypothetical protein